MEEIAFSLSLNLEALNGSTLTDEKSNPLFSVSILKNGAHTNTSLQFASYLPKKETILDHNAEISDFLGVFEILNIFLWTYAANKIHKYLLNTLSSFTV